MAALIPLNRLSIKSVHSLENEKLLTALDVSSNPSFPITQAIASLTISKGFANNSSTRTVIVVLSPPK